MKKMVIRRRKRNRYKRVLRAGLVIIALALLVLFAVLIFREKELPVVRVSVSDVEMREDESFPGAKVSATCDVDFGKVILDRKNKYTLEMFIDDINNGMGYVAEPNADFTKEGDYLISVDLNQELREKYEEKWYKKFNLVMQDGHLHVKSKHGDWDGKMFVLLDGSYAEGWHDIGDDTYYFGENNEYLVGEQVVDERTYYFGDDGKFDKEKNLYNPTKPVVALTFDDGPGAYTMELLEFLESNGAKATFFMLGSKVSKYPDEVKKMLEIGCELGNHSTNHLQLTKGSNGEVDSEIQKTHNAIKEITGQKASCIRPPYGSYNDKVKEIADKPLILWSLDTLDWEYRDVEKIKNEIRKTIKDGDVVLMHDIYDTTVQAIKEMIVELQEEGYQFLTVSELAEVRNVELSRGKVYNNFYKK